MVSIALAAVVLGGISMAAPTPRPSSYPVIVTVKSTVFCSTVRKLVIPLGYITHRNDEAFTAVAGDAEQYWGMSGYAGLAARYDALQRAQRKGAPTSTWSQQTALLHAEAAIRAVQDNLSTERDFLQRSLKDTPPGKDANVDAIRKQLENLMDLQQALANHVTFQEGDVPPADDRCIQALSFAITTCGPIKLMTALDAQAANGSRVNKASFENPFAASLDSDAASVNDVARRGSPADITRVLTQQEDTFTKMTVAAANTCGI